MKYLIYNIVCIIIFLLITQEISMNYKVIESNSNYLSYIRQYYKNENIKGIIKIGELTEPFAQSDDNKYYLNHNLYNKYDIKGSVFMDYRNRINDKIVIIYGHNSKDYDVPFKYLENYYDEEFVKLHNIIETYTDDIINKYIIFSVFIEYEDWFYINFENNYEEYLNKIINKSWIKFNINITEKDSIIILQTCSYHPNYSNYKDKYLLIIGKKIEN